MLLLLNGNAYSVSKLKEEKNLSRSVNIMVNSFYIFTAESQIITVSEEIIVLLTLTESHIFTGDVAKLMRNTMRYVK